MSFDSASVRLRRKAVKQLKQTNAQQLEIETKKMEERIQALKEQMMREKEERERSGGIKWNSSKPGPFVSGRTQQETKKKSPRKDKGARKIKMLSDEPLSSYVRKNVTVESQNDFANTGFGVCGQCERTKAGLICIECGENYCTECFKTFHQKGALKKHTVKNFKQDDKNHFSSRNRVPSQTTARSPGIASELSSMQNGSIAGDDGGSLLKGSYNEEESSALFAQALREWRNSQTVKNSNSWVNRTDNIQNGTSETSVGVSCGSSTVAAKLKEVKIEFQENNSLSYMDRLMLKKNKKNPLKSVTKPISVGISSGKETKSKLPDNYSFSDSDESKGEFDLNYKELLLKVCSPAWRLNHETQSDGSRVKSQFPYVRNDRREVNIEEVPVSSSDNLDETSACIVEEANENDSLPQSVAWPSSQSGRVSIMTLTSTGDFREDAEALTVEDVSSLSSGSPGSESRTPVTQCSGTLHIKCNQTESKLGVGRNLAAHAGVKRVWSAKSSYTGLSSFFLSGVKNDCQPVREEVRKGTDRAVSSIVSLGLLNKALWKPEDSVIISDVTNGNIQANRGSEDVFQHLPIIQLPESRNNSVINETVSVVSEEPENNNISRIRGDWSQQQDTENIHKIHDFGIVDFLQTGPIPSKRRSDYNLLHRVSTVSPLALSPNPPNLNWSDDESDDFIEEVVSRAQFREGRLRDKQDQDADDTATLNDLAWELQSTSGNRSPTPDGIDCLMGTKNSLEQGMDQFNRDSIDEDDFRSELEDISYDSDSIDEVDEDRASKMDVAALE